MMLELFAKVSQTFGVSRGEEEGRGKEGVEKGGERIITLPTTSVRSSRPLFRG